jgi:hypothetical protein
MNVDDAKFQLIVMCNNGSFGLLKIGYSTNAVGRAIARGRRPMLAILLRTDVLLSAKTPSFNNFSNCSQSQTPNNASASNLYAISSFVHICQFVLSGTIPSSAIAPSSWFSNTVIICSRWLFRSRLATEVDGFQLAPLASPYTHRCHHGGAAYLEHPPKEVRGYGVRI